MAKTAGAAPKPPKVKVATPAKAGGVKAKGSAGAYKVTTGDNERKVVSYKGSTVRVGPNSQFAPKNAPKPTITSRAQDFFNMLLGRTKPTAPSGTTSVRG